MTYAEKLRSPKWQKKRLEILQRDDFTCCLCGDTETTLHVHHKEYKFNREPWDYPLNNFQSLCDFCHALSEFLKHTSFVILKVYKHGTNSFGNIDCWFSYLSNKNPATYTVGYITRFEDGQFEMQSIYELDYLFSILKSLDTRGGIDG